MIKKNPITYELKCIILTLIAATISFSSLHIFVIPSDFSPSGIDGVSTILYELTGINIGWFKILFNIPLMVLAWIFLKRRYVFYVIGFTILDSLGVIFLESIDFYTFIPAGLTAAEAIGYRLIAALAAGVALGIVTGIMLKIGCSTGGIDIVACIVNLKKPNLNVERIISIICYVIIGCSYFVYHDLTSILLSAIQIFAFECTASYVLKGDRYALEVKIITKHPETIRDSILFKHQHSATIIEAKGMYSEEPYSMVVTVINSREIAEFMQTLKQYPDTFIYFSDGIRVQGDFHFGDKVSKRVDAY